MAIKKVRPDVDIHTGDGSSDAIVLAEATGEISHQDIGQIAVTDIDGITINRTKTGISPFVPITKTPAYSQNSGTLSGYAVEIEDPSSPTGYTHVGNVSRNYLLLSNEEVRNLAVEIAVQSGIPFRESRIFWDGSRFCHIIDFTEYESVSDGDEIGLSLITRSSYDKTWKYDCALMGKRFLCDNGAISGEFFARVSFKHLSMPNGAEVPQEYAWKQIVRDGMTVIDRAPDDLSRFVENLRLLRSASMTDDHLRRVWKALPTIGDGIKGQVLSRYVEREEPTLYGLFNAGTAVFSHRGDKTTAADFANNDAFTTALLGYASEHLN